MIRLFFATILLFALTACNVDLVLPRESDEGRLAEEATVVDLNARTQNRAIINGQ